MPDNSLTGVLPVDKPVGPTSHDVVAAARRALHVRRVGHSGTLDPFASGLLLLCVGTATRLAEFLTGLPKTYVGTIRFGSATDSDDRTGSEIARSESWRALTPAQIDEALQALVGELVQVPPVYSAKKVRGVAMHRLARRGEAPAPAPVRVHIDSIRLLGVNLPDAEIELVCSAGTYVRALARDIGVAVGSVAHLAELRRTRIGSHDVAQAIPLAALEDPASVDRVWLDPLDALRHLPRVDTDPPSAAALAHGAVAAAPPGTPDGIVAVAVAGRLLAIVQVAAGIMRPTKVFADE